jgi:hypothetical protein
MVGRYVVARVLLLLVLALGVLGCEDDSVNTNGFGFDASVGLTPFDGSTPDSAPPPSSDAGTEAGAVGVVIVGALTPLTVQGQRAFTATVTGSTNTAVTWSVKEPDGGAITSGGEYTAPATPGTFTIVATSVADPSKRASAAIEIVAAPNATMTAPTVATAGATNLTASVPAQSGATYAWTIMGGTITGGASNAITFTAGAAGTLVLTCVVTNEAGTSATGTRSVAVSDAPVVSISAPASATTGDTGLVATVPTQTGATYAWTIAGGTITGGAATASITFTAGAPGALTLGCSVTIAGTTVSGNSTVNVLAAPVVPVITAPAAVASAATGLTASIPTQAGVTFNWSIANGTITAGQGTNAITFSSGSPGVTTLTCVVTNGAGRTANGTRDVTVVAPPSALVFTAPAFVTTGTSGHSASVATEVGITYEWTIAGGTITSATNSANVTFTAGAAVGPLTLGCTATNAVGQSVNGSVIVTVVATPVVAITAPASVNASSTGHTATVTAQTGATYAWTIAGGTLTAGQGTSAITFSVGTTSPVTIGCTITNQAGVAVDGSASVTVNNGSLVVTLTGAPPNANVVVTGPGGYTSTTFSATTTLTNLAPGSYTVVAPNRVSGGLTYTATIGGSPAAVTNGPAAASVSYVSSNSAPTISAIANQAITAGSATPAIAFVVNDAEDAAASLSVTGAVTLSPGLDSAFTFAGTTGNRTVILTPSAVAGVRQITLTVTDSQGAKATALFYLTANASATAPSPIVTTNAEFGVGSLKDVYAAVAPNTIITFAPSTHGQTITFASPLAIGKRVTILGHGPELMAISGGLTTLHFRVNSTTATFIGLTLRDGRGTDGSLDIFGATTAAAAVISRCVFTNNASTVNGWAVIGGGSYTLDISDSMFTGNGVTGNSGVLVSNAATTLRNDTFANNTVIAAVTLWGGTHDVTNCTFVQGPTANSAIDTDATTRISHSTITGDPALNTGGIRVRGGNVSLRNTILGEHGADRSFIALGGTVTSLGNNLIDAASALFTPLASDQVGVALGLDPLGSYGGWTQTRRVQATSNARDKIPAASCLDAAGNALTTDQRGFARPVGATCDVGAFERQATD